MSDLDKINIYVPEHIGTVIDNDAELFEVLKKDGRTINRNRFLSLLILGYHNSYVTECQQAYEKITAELIKGGIESARSYDIAESSPLAIPIIYVNDISDPYAFGYPHQDDYIEYDNYGEPVYSGTYFREFGKDGRVIKVDRECLPKEIWEGVFVISETVPIKAEPSGAQKQIFCDGKFMAD